MHLESLYYFLEVLKTGSFTEAAGTIFMSQQGLSKAIHSLEKELAVTLLKRGGNDKVVPTEAGKLLSSAALEILNAWEDTKKQMSSYTASGALMDSSAEQPCKTTVLITTYVANVFSFLFDRRECQSYLHSSEEITVREKSFGKIKRELLESPADTVALINATPAAIAQKRDETNSRLVVEPILGMDVMIECSPDFFAAKKKMVTLRELRSLPLALFDDPMLSVVVQSLFGSEDSLDIRMHTTNKNKIREAVARGEVVTFTDSFIRFGVGSGTLQTTIPKEHRCIAIEGDTRFVIGFLSVAGVQRSASCLRYEAFCKNYLKAKYGFYMKRHPL